MDERPEPVTAPDRAGPGAAEGGRLSAGDVAAAAGVLAAAGRDLVPVAPLTATFGPITPGEAYEIQLVNVRRRLDAGAAIVGHKVGLTSPAMQALMGVYEPDYGHLLDDMVLPSGTTIPIATMCQPRVEVEVAFVLARPLHGPGCTVDDVLAATDYVVGSIEVIDSRIAGWKLSLPDTIADNASSGLVVLGADRHAPTEIDLRLNGVVLRRNGRLVETGASGAVLGNPAVAVAWLADKLASFGTGLDAGAVVMPGSCTGAVPVDPGDRFEAEFDHLGTVVVDFG